MLGGFLGFSLKNNNNGTLNEVIITADQKTYFSIVSLFASFSLINIGPITNPKIAPIGVAIELIVVARALC
jgi:hypothetical protein